MKRTSFEREVTIVLAAVLCATATMDARAQAADPLPSWNDGKAKQSITAFVARVTKAGSPDFVPVADRVATFDNDGTLWAEQPMYFQLQFAIDRVKELAPQHPEWKELEPFKSVLVGDLKTALAGGAPALIQLVAAGSSDMTPDEFDRIVKGWIAKAKHPKTGHMYSEMADAEREWSYDVSPMGKLEKGLEEAKAKGWTVVDMKTDWKVIFASGKN